MIAKDTKTKKVPRLRFQEFDSEWQAKKLGDIAQFSRGKNISKDDIADNGKIEAIRYGELYTRYGEVVERVYSKTNLDPKTLSFSKYNDVIIPGSGETNIDIATASCVLKDGVALSGDINIIRTSNNGIFLAYYLNNSKKLAIARLAQGNSVVHLYASSLKSLLLSFPSQEEQKKIADFLTAVDNKIIALQDKIALLQKYRKGAMQAIFSQKIRFKDDSEKNFPAWQKSMLGEVFDQTKGFGISKEQTIESGTNKCVLYGELYTTYSEVIQTVESRTNVATGVKSKVGDLLVPCSTTTTGIDLANITELREDNVLLGGDITILRFNESGCSTFYAYYLTHFKTKEIAKYAQGSTIVHLYYNHFKKMLIDVPVNHEQQKIADFLSSIDDRLNLTRKELEQAKTFKKVLLQQMFV